MACRSVLRTALLTERFMRLPFITRGYSSFPRIISFDRKISNPNIGCKISINDQSFIFVRNCSYGRNSSPFDGDSEYEPPQEAVPRAISEVSRTEGRVGQTTNVVIGGTVTDGSASEWIALDQKVNSYPTVRRFTAIGTGGDNFVHAMIVAVESVLQKPIPEGQVKQKISSSGKYVSVNIGPVQVVSSDQVQAVYNAMRRDNRVKYFL